jgi:uncharacterized protein YjbI with pentapeptide repeats
MSILTVGILVGGYKLFLQTLEQWLLSSSALWILMIVSLIAFISPLVNPSNQPWLVEKFYSTTQLPPWVETTPKPDTQKASKQPISSEEDTKCLELYFKLLDELRQKLLTLGGGIVGIRTLILGLHKFEQSKKEERNKRFHEAIALLGNQASDTRIGGLVSLERLMQEDPTTMGERIVSLLVSFINNRGQYASKTDDKSYFYPADTTSIAKPEGFTPSHAPYEDIKLAFQILAERALPEPVEAKINFDFPDIDHSLFYSPNWNLYHAYVGKDKQNKQNTKGKHFIKANLQGVDLQGADLYEAKLQDAKLQEANLQKADLRRANLQGANLQEARLEGADLQWAKLQGADLFLVKLQSAKLQGAKLQGANLQEATLYEARLEGADLQGADLQWAKLQGANLQMAELQRTELQSANLKGSDLQHTNLQGSALQGTNLQYARLQNAYDGYNDEGELIRLTFEALRDRGILWDEETIFPDWKRYGQDGTPLT